MGTTAQDAERMRAGVRACRASVGYLSLAASLFARRVEDLLAEKPLSASDAQALASDLATWCGKAVQS